MTAVFRVNELLNWEVARAAAVGEISVGDASSSKVFAADQVQHLLDELTRVVHRYGDPSDEETGTLMEYLDGQKKRNLVLTFGGGVQEVQRELIAMFGLGPAAGAPLMGDSARPDHGRGRADQGARRGSEIARAVRRQPGRRSAPGWTRWATTTSGSARDEAPPSMAQVWTMPGLGRKRPPEDPLSRMTEFLTDEGYTAVLGTNCEQSYERYLRVGEEVRVTSALDSVAGPKNTAMGEGYFVTSRNTWYVGERGRRHDAVPGAQVHPQGGLVTRPPDGEPRLAVLLGRHQGRRAADPEVQRVRREAVPARPGLPVAARRYDRGYDVAAGTGTVFSYVVHRHPPVPGKELPIVIALIDLDEGVRMVGEVVDVA